MIVVMPAGHTSRTPVSAIGRSATDEFVQDFVQDVMPYVEKHYRVIADRAHRAIAGLSMGGNHTLHVAMPRLDQFAYVGVFSSGLLAAAPAGRGSPPAPGTPPPAPALDEAWVRENVAGIDAGAKKHALELFWFATGSEDRLLPATKATVEMFKQHRFTPVFKESAGGHTWLNWRDYLTEFAPQLFH
jgi:enterochelin esterase family protein